MKIGELAKRAKVNIVKFLPELNISPESDRYYWNWLKNANRKEMVKSVQF